MLVKTKMLGFMLATAVALTSPILVWADDSSTTLTTGGVAPAGGGNPSRQNVDWHHGYKDHMTAKILNLSEDQEKQLNGIKQKQKDAKKSIFEQMKSNRAAFEAEIVKATPDMNKINGLQTQIKSIQSQMVDDHLNFILEIKKIMTPEQFAGYMALEREEDLMKHEGYGKFGHKDGFGKDGEGHEHWGDRD